MKIGVVIPAYNAATTMQSTLQSVFEQSVPPFEILVLDDGSTDDTAGILASLQGQVKVIPGSHSGAAVARKIAQCSWINFLAAQFQKDLLARYPRWKGVR
jgi:glycosyltransferase involved in cell wall biosynthesis